MRIDSFEWDAGNDGHVARHRVTRDEAEEVFAAWYYVIRGRDGRYVAIGQTAAGRYLFCVFERSGLVGQIRIITARDAELWERRLFKIKR
jgi:uncharacterized DUF497 family protein